MRDFLAGSFPLQEVGASAAQGRMDIRCIYVYMYRNLLDEAFYSTQY